MPDKFEKFTDRARRVLSLAQEEAQRFNHNYIGTEHILLGLIREEDGVAARVLSNMGVDLGKARTAVQYIIGRGDSQKIGELGLTPRAKKVIELAARDARKLHHHYIGTEHLLGLLDEGQGIAACVLRSLDFDFKSARWQVNEVIIKASTSMGTGEW
jgi:ATP-dependent Clp protease ATP-binding subunit ClpC